MNIEDTLFGGALVDLLVSTGEYEPATDAAIIARDMWMNNRDNLLTYIDPTDHMARLKANHLEDSVPYCLTLNSAAVVPELTIEEGILVLRTR